MQIFKLFIIILLFSQAFFVRGESTIKSTPLDIVITEADIHIGNIKLNTPPNEDDLTAVMGNYSRAHGGALAWDNIGIEIFRGYKKSKLIRSFKIFLKKRTPFEKPTTNSLGRHIVDMRPIHDFTGKLTIDGVEITSETTIRELNKSLKGAEFSKETLYKTYRRSYVPNPQNKKLSCTIYVKLSDLNKVYQVSRSCIDWRKYSVKSSIKVSGITKNKKKNIHSNKTDELSIVDAHQKKYSLSDKQLVEFEKRLKVKKKSNLVDKATLIEDKLRNGEITQKQADSLVMQLLIPGLTSEKVKNKNKAHDVISRNKDDMSQKDQAALKIAVGFKMLQEMLGSDSLNETELQKIAEQVKKEIPAN